MVVDVKKVMAISPISIMAIPDDGTSADVGMGIAAIVAVEVMPMSIMTCRIRGVGCYKEKPEAISICESKVRVHAYKEEMIWSYACKSQLSRSRVAMWYACKDGVWWNACQWMNVDSDKNGGPGSH